MLSIPHLLLLVAMSPFIVPDKAKDGEFHPGRICFQYELHDSHAVYKGPVSSIHLKARANTDKL